MHESPAPAVVGHSILGATGTMIMSLFPIPNEYVLLVSGIALIALVVWEYFDTQVLLSFGDGKQDQRPLELSSVSTADQHVTTKLDNEHSDGLSTEPVRISSVAETATAVSSVPEDPTLIDSDTEDTNQTPELQQLQARFQERISVSASITNTPPKQMTREEVETIVSKIMDPLPKGCEPYGPNADFMAEKFPNLTRPDIVRFLVARKGVVAAACEMAEKCMEWRKSVFPLKREDLKGAIRTGCFFPYKAARDGTPCVYMRGGMYDNTKATPEQFVLAAAYAIEYSLRTHPDQINVTVVVDTSIIPGAPNPGADMTFIKQFVKVLSDNYPERLKRIVMYPFPWYGRAIWSVVKVFIDKRTQDKALLIADSGKREIPPELAKFVDPDNIPVCCAGNCKDPILDLLTTLK